MKAIVYTNYGSPEVLHIQEVARPNPKDNEILVRVYAAPVNFGDFIARNFQAVTPQEFSMPFLFWIMTKFAFGVSKPKVNILGSEFAGVVDSVGKNVTMFKQGDQVFGYRGQSMGTYAEYVCMPEIGCITFKPSNLTYQEAASVAYGSIMALNLLRKMNIQPGQKVLINGASGGIGSAAVQIAKHYGAEVTGVCSTPRLEYVKSLGADKVIDYTKEDFTQNNETYDLIFDVLGKSSFSHCKNSLNARGRILYASFKMPNILQMLWTSIIGDKKVICAFAPGSREDLLSVKELIEAGKIKPIVDRCFPIEQAAEAHRHYESGDKKGSVVITFIQDTKG